MLRVVLTIALPLLLPTALYLFWVMALHPQGEARLPHRGAVPWLWLGAAGTVLLALVLVAVTVRFGAPQSGIYVPPRYVGGHIVNSHILPGGDP